jgi:hypothetical protein
MVGAGLGGASPAPFGLRVLLGSLRPAWPPLFFYNRIRVGRRFGLSEPHRTRTCNPLIKSQLLYQLS